MCEYLAGPGYGCVPAYSGSEGSMRFAMESFDFVLMDLMLSGRTGEELMAEFAGKVPVIVIFVKNELDSKIEMLSAGANDYRIMSNCQSGWIGRVFYNLIQNALRHGTGTIRITQKGSIMFFFNRILGEEDITLPSFLNGFIRRRNPERKGLPVLD